VRTFIPRQFGVFSVWLVLLPAFAALDLASPVAVRWAREPRWDTQGLAIHMGCLMASYGALVGQWSALAAWSALRPSRWLTAIAFSWAVSSALFALYLRALIQLGATSVDWPSAWFAPLASLTLQAPFFACRAMFGWRWERGQLADRGRLRFTIGDLLAITAAVAVILAVSRSAVSSSAGGGLGGGPTNVGAGDGLRLGFQLGQTAACISFALMGVGVVWPAFASLFVIRRKAVAILILLIDVVCATALISAAAWALQPGLSFATFAWNFAAPILTTWKEPNGGQSFAQLSIAAAGLVGGWAAVAIPSFLAFRFAGFRLDTAQSPK
jgi:hypothetical protein